MIVAAVQINEKLNFELKKVFWPLDQRIFRVRATDHISGVHIRLLVHHDLYQVDQI